MTRTPRTAHHAPHTGRPARYLPLASRRPSLVWPLLGRRGRCSCDPAWEAGGTRWRVVLRTRNTIKSTICVGFWIWRRRREMVRACLGDECGCRNAARASCMASCGRDMGRRRCVRRAGAHGRVLADAALGDVTPWRTRWREARGNRGFLFQVLCQRGVRSSTICRAWLTCANSRS